MESTSQVEALLEKVKDYIETRIELLKLKAIDKSSGILSTIISFLVLFIFSILFVILFSIGLALLIGDLLGKYYYGFFIVAALYIIIGLVVFYGRNKWIKPTVEKGMINSFLD